MRVPWVVPGQVPVPDPAGAEPPGGPLWPPDWSQFLPDVVSTAVGAALALIAAVLVEWRLRALDQRDRTRDELADRRRTLTFVRAELAADRDVVRLLPEWVRDTTDLPPPLHLDVWRSVTVDVLRATRSLGVPAAYRSLVTLQARLDDYAEKLRGDTASYAQARRQRLPAILESAAEVARTCETALAELDVELRDAGGAGP